MSQTITEAPRRGLLAHLRGGRAGEPWTWKRTLALVLLFAISLVTFGAMSMGTAHAEEDDDVMKYSFYKLSSSMTAFFSSAQGPDAEEGKSLGADEDWQQLLANPGSAGSFLGYADPNFSDVTGWLSSKLSGSSDAIGYETLALKDSEDIALPADQQGLVAYAYFGAALNGMGLDGTSTGLSSGFMNWISGGVIMLLYLSAGVVDFLFSAVISILVLLNPFKLFFLGVQAIAPTFADGMVGGDTSDLGPLSGLASWIGGWYQALNSLAWTVMVPLFIATLLAGMLLFKKMNRGGAIKKLLIRIAFIGLGLPLLGSMYTGTLTSMQAATESGNAGATRVVLSTYVDFENWAMNGRLTVPEGATIEWDGDNNTPTSAAQQDVRNTTLAINNQTLGLKLDQTLNAGNASSWTNSALEAGSEEYGFSSKAYAKTMDMLWRFMGGAQVSAATFETEAKGQLANTKIPNSTIKSWFDEGNGDIRGDDDRMRFTNDGDLKDISGDRINANPVISLASESGLRASGGGSTYTFSSANVSPGCYTHSGTKITSNDNPAPRNCNLSPLAMYNYLNTDFGSTSMTMYSSSNSMSEATRSIHNSVNQVGTGTMSFLYWFNAVVLLGSFVVIGFGYAISMVITNIRRSIQIMTAVPFATLGAMAAIAKVIVYSIALILQIIVTIFMYKLVQEFLVALPQIVEMPFSTILNNGVGGDAAGFVTFLLNSTGFSLVITLVSIIVIVAFTVMAMRARKSIVKAIEEAVTKLVEKFTDSQVGLPGGGGKMMPALAGGMAAGAGAAAANRMMGGASAKGPKAAAIPGAGNGPEGVSTGDGTPLPGGGAGGAGGTGDGADSTVSGEIETGDGTLGIEGGVDGPADGNGDPGSPLELPPGSEGATAASETAEGKRVEAEGLSQDGGAGEAGGTRDVQPGSEPDVADSAAASLEESAEGYKDADKKKLAVGTEGAQAVGHAGLAVGKGFAGDAAGAAESGGRAVEHGGKAAAAGEQAKHAEKEAGRSSLDAPDTKHAERAAKAEKVSQAGGTVANAAGAASATGGAAKGAQGAAKEASGTSKQTAQAGKGAQPSKGAQASVQQQRLSQPKAPARSDQPGRPQAPAQRQAKPMQQPQAPAQRQAKPTQQRQAPAPKPQAAPRQTVVNKSSQVTNSTDRRSKTVNKARKPKPIRPAGNGGKGYGGNGGKKKK